MPPPRSSSPPMGAICRDDPLSKSSLPQHPHPPCGPFWTLPLFFPSPTGSPVTRFARRRCFMSRCLPAASSRLSIGSSELVASLSPCVCAPYLGLSSAASSLVGAVAVSCHARRKHTVTRAGCTLGSALTHPGPFDYPGPAYQCTHG